MYIHSTWNFKQIVFFLQCRYFLNLEFQQFEILIPNPLITDLFRNHHAWYVRVSNFSITLKYHINIYLAHVVLA